MQKIKFDTGLEEYRIGQDVLRFNPRDPNLYSRFLAGAEKISALEQEMAEKAGQAVPGDGEATVKLLEQADRKMKVLLQEIFGSGNDFDRILGGVSLLAVAGNGQRVITNLFEALQPILMAGAERCAREKTAQAVQAAESRRAKQ